MSRADNKNILPFPIWTLIYCLSGFIALSLEITWFRLLNVMLKATSFTFPTLLTIFLGGLALGTFVGIGLVRRVKRPDRLFFLFQGLIPLYSGLALALFVTLVGNIAALDIFWEHLSDFEPVSMWPVLDAISGIMQGSFTEFSDQSSHIWTFSVINFALPIYLIAPPTILMGISFPLLQRTVQLDLAQIGRHVGWLQAANIVGSMAGAFVVGLASLRLIGTPWTLRVLILLGGLYLVAWALVKREGSIKYARLVIVSIITIAVAFSIPTGKVLWSKLIGAAPAEIVFAESGEALSIARADSPAPDGKGFVYVNGDPVSPFPYGATHTLLGFIPAMLHPNPSDVAIIGLGTGDTLFSLAGRQEIESIRCIELIKKQPDVLKEFNDTIYHSEAIDAILTDPRIEFVFTDGKAYIKRGERHYDIIEADAHNPEQAFSGNLYSYNYFLSARAKLKPGGYAVTWAPTLRVLKSFVKAFPFVLQFGNVLVGSETDIAYDPRLISERISDPRVVAHYRKAALDVNELAARAFSKEPTAYGPNLDRSLITDINTDLFPRDEFMVEVVK